MAIPASPSMHLLAKGKNKFFAHCMTVTCPAFYFRRTLLHRLVSAQSFGGNRGVVF